MCTTCPILLATDMLSSHTTGEQFRKKISTSCKSSSVICLITCRRRGQQYVGKTGQPLHCRINSHRFDIMHRRTEDSPMAVHFNSNAHSQADMALMVIDQVHSHDPCLRKIQESRWIHTLGTSYPLGMNLRVDSLWNLPVPPVDLWETPCPLIRLDWLRHTPSRMYSISCVLFFI